MKVKIVDIARVIASVTPDCSFRIHDFDSMTYDMKIRFMCEAKKFIEVSNILIENSKKGDKEE